MPDIERTYPRVGYLATVSDAVGVRSFTYDAHFNLTGETLGNRTLTYTYATTGVKGRYTGLTGNHTYGYDQYSRINQINGIAYTRLAAIPVVRSIFRAISTRKRPE